MLVRRGLLVGRRVVAGWVVRDPGEHFGEPADHHFLVSGALEQRGTGQAGVVGEDLEHVLGH